MTKDCNTCVCKEGSCYPSATIFDKDKTCKSYTPDYEGYIAELEKENAELKVSCKIQVDTAFQTIYEKDDQLTNAKEIIKKLKALYFSPVVTTDDVKRQDEILAEAEQFISEVEK